MRLLRRAVSSDTVASSREAVRNLYGQVEESANIARRSDWFSLDQLHNVIVLANVGDTWMTQRSNGPSLALEVLTCLWLGRDVFG
jgi:hypothetical protein